MKLTLDRNHIRNEHGEAVASVPHTLGDESDRAMARLLVGAVNMLPRLLEAIEASNLQAPGLLAEGQALLDGVSK